MKYRAIPLICIVLYIGATIGFGWRHSHLPSDFHNANIKHEKSMKDDAAFIKRGLAQAIVANYVAKNHTSILKGDGWTVNVKEFNSPGQGATERVTRSAPSALHEQAHQEILELPNNACPRLTGWPIRPDVRAIDLVCCSKAIGCTWK